MEALFSASRIGHLVLKNRLVALPVFTGYALPDARVPPLLIEHYRRLGESGAAMVVVPNIAVSANGRTSERSLILDHDQHIPAFSRLAQVIKENGGLARVRRRILGSVSETLLNELTECSFAIVG